MWSVFILVWGIIGFACPKALLLQRFWRKQSVLACYMYFELFRAYARLCYNLTIQSNKPGFPLVPAPLKFNRWSDF